MSDYDEYEEPPWLSDLHFANSFDSCQYSSPLGDSSAPVLSNIGQFDFEMSSGELADESFWPEFWPDLLPSITDHEEPGDNRVISSAHQSTCAAIETVLIPEKNIVEFSGLSRSASVRCRWPNLVRLICACNRFCHAASPSLRAKVSNVLKGVMKKKGKYVCEIRVMMKMQKEKKKVIRKVWLGTYNTEAQAALALDVGKFFFSSKEIKSFYRPNSETILSRLSHLLAQPLEELVKDVKKLAKHYGENGTLQNFVLRDGHLPCAAGGTVPCARCNWN